MNLEHGGAWVGWFRPRDRVVWEQLVEADTEDEALDLLLAVARSSGDLVVLPADKVPWKLEAKVLSGRLRHPAPTKIPVRGK
jgi:hypothetical protein